MLPCDNDPIRPPMAYKLSIGEVKTKDGKTYPAKQDYFTIRRLSVQSGQKATYIVDQQMQEELCKAVGVKEQPRVVPVSVIGNPVLRTLDSGEVVPDLPPSILWSRMAYYWGSKCVCSCNEFGEDGTGTATFREWEKLTGLGPKGDREIVKVKAEKQLTCNPQTCPWATGLHTMTSYYGLALCKPQIMASFVLPFAPSVGAVAVLKTTGWHTYRALRDSLLSIASQTGGWLHRIPLLLVYGHGRASDGKLVPQLRIERPGTEEALLDEAARLKERFLGQQTQLKQLEAGVVSVVTDDLGNPEAESAFQAEFAPEGVGEDVTEITEAEFTPAGAEDGPFAPTPEEEAAIREQEAAEYANSYGGAQRLFEEGAEQ